MVTVIQNKGSKEEEIIYIEATAGCNVRQLLTDNGINVYQSVTRWTNCKGKQLCGTCIVNIVDGAGNTNRKSLDEGSTLRENPESYRLSCVSFAYGDITVETFPPIEAAQWTRFDATMLDDQYLSTGVSVRPSLNHVEVPFFWFEAYLMPIWNLDTEDEKGNEVATHY
eukprot:scaffold24085_cov125-Skeletonema_marinoi.AAC.1